MVRLIENIVITIDVCLLLGSEIYLFWLIDLMIDLFSVGDIENVFLVWSI